jgi:hypothetical protein
MEPGARLSAVHRRILASDPSLVAVSATPVRRTVPRPAAVARGRDHARISRRQIVA